MMSISLENIQELHILPRNHTTTENDLQEEALRIAIRMLKSDAGLEVSRVLRRGTFSDYIAIKLPEHRTELAVKVTLAENAGHLEVNIWQYLQHSNILRLIGARYLPLSKMYFFVTDLETCNLENVLEDKVFLKDSQAANITRKWIRDAVSGLQYLHGQGFCHLDLKPTNVLISRDVTAKLCSFYCLDVTSQPTKNYVISPKYSPPEVTYSPDGTPEVCVQGIQFDIWTLGVMALNIFTNHYLRKKTVVIHPAWTKDVYPVIYEVLQKKKFAKCAKMAFPACCLGLDTLKEMRNFVTSCLHVLPQERPLTETLLSHKYLENGGPLGTKDRLWSKKTSGMKIQKKMQKCGILMKELTMKQDDKPALNIGNNENTELPLIMEREIELHSKNSKSKSDVCEIKAVKQCSTPVTGLMCFSSQPGSSKQSSIIDRTSVISDIKIDPILKSQLLDKRNSDKSVKESSKTSKGQSANNCRDDAIVADSTSPTSEKDSGTTII